MNAEFDWWLLLVGIVGGAALVWLVVGDLRRRDDDLADDERQLEAEWIADAFGAAGRDIDETTVSEVLELHRAYLAGPAPELDPIEGGAAPTPAPDGLPTRAAIGSEDGYARANGPRSGVDEAVAGYPGPTDGATDAVTEMGAPHSPRVRDAGVSAPAPARGGAQPRQAPGDGS